MHTCIRMFSFMAAVALVTTVVAGPATAQTRARQRAGTAQIATPQATRAVDMFIKLDGIDGEATDSAHEGWIEVEAWSWGESNSSRRQSSPVGNGPGALTLTRTVDRASARLQQACTSGTVMGVVVVHTRASGGGYNEYVMDDTRVSSCSQSSAGDRPTENVTLNFARVRSTDGNPDRPIVVGR